MITVTMIIAIILLLFVVGDAAYLCIRRSLSSPPASRRLQKITLWRMGVRICAAAALLLVYFLLIKSESSSQLLQNIWQGAYIGFTTNALVTFVLLKVFVQKMKSTIASTITDKISELVKAEPEPGDSTKGIRGNKVRIGAIVEILRDFLGYTGGKVIKAEIEAKIKNIEIQIKSMSNDQIADTMDEIIGNLLTVVEVLGLLLGIVFAFLLSV